MKRTKNGFFSVDLDQALRIGELNLGIEELAAYLALACGTNESNRVSCWGINAICEHTGLSRTEARRAVGALVGHGLLADLEPERKRARTVPRYEFFETDKRQRLTAKELEVVRKATAGESPASKPERNAIERARQKGHVERVSGQWTVIPNAPDLAFIPNSFVRTETGRAPLRRLLDTGETDPLLLAVELYARQDLENDRGVPPELVNSFFSGPALNVGLKVRKLAVLSPWRTWGETTFSECAVTHKFRATASDNDRFWNALQVLQQTHVVEWTVYQAHGKPKHEYDRGRVIAPLGVVRNGMVRTIGPEAEPAFLSRLIHALRTEPERDLQAIWQAWKEAPGQQLVAIADISVPHVEGIGILRMAHRAETEKTRRWYAEHCRLCEERTFFLRQILGEISSEPFEIEGFSEPHAAVGSTISR